MPTKLRVLEQGSVVRGSSLQCHIHFGWDPPAEDNGAPIDKYEIELMRNVFSYVDGILCETDSFLELETVVVTSPEYTFGGLNPGVTHRVRVRVHNGCGWTDYTNWLVVKTIGCPPDAPLPFGRALAMRAAWKGGVMVFGAWGVPIPNGEPIDAYEMQVRPVGEQAWDTVRNNFKHTCGTAVAYKGLPLFPSTRYQLRSRAHNTYGWGPWTSDAEDEGADQVIVRTLDTEPQRPEPPRLKSYTSSSMTVEWVPPPDGGTPVQNFELQCKSVAMRGARRVELGLTSLRTEWYTLTKELGMETEFTIRDICFEKYIFRIRAQNALGWSFYSEPSKEMRMEKRL